MVTSSRRPPSPRVRAILALGLGLVGLVLVWAALAGPPRTEPVAAEPPLEQSAPAPLPVPSASPTQPTSHRSTATGRSDVRDRMTGRVLPESDPVSVSVPKIGVRSRLVRLGLDADGAMEVPGDPSLAGWFTHSAAPGALGPAVIAGHVTWNRAPAVFDHLGTLRRGDRVEISRRDGRTVVFTVDRVARFSKSQFPSRAVYGPIDHAGLRLITCGGTYDTARHRYLDNVVVFASLTAVREPRG